MGHPRKEAGNNALNPKHDLGQNFLLDKILISRLVEKCDITPNDSVLEIGPGPGTLTSCLCETAGKVVAVEVDHDIIPFLKASTLQYNNLDIILGDIRKMRVDDLCLKFPGSFSVISNIPYNITTPIIDILFDSRLPIDKICLMVQKEVANKLAAVPGSSEYCLLSVRRALIADCSIIETIPASCFTPPPKVDSAFIRMDINRNLLNISKNPKLLFTLLKTGYQYRRKTLPNALKSVVSDAIIVDALRQIGFDEKTRAEVLSAKDWVLLSNIVCSISAVEE